MHIVIANLRWRGKRSLHSRLMCNPQFCVSGKRPNGHAARSLLNRVNFLQSAHKRFEFKEIYPCIDLCLPLQCILEWPHMLGWPSGLHVCKAKSTDISNANLFTDGHNCMLIRFLWFRVLIETNKHAYIWHPDQLRYDFMAITILRCKKRCLKCALLDVSSASQFSYANYIASN